MTKVLIATFSQTGSTKKIADRIAKGLSSSNCEVTHLSISNSRIPDPHDYDIIGIGTPTYFFRPPFIAKDFVKSIKGLENKSSFVFILHGTNPGDCGNWIRRELNKKGLKDLGYLKSFGADYWIGYIKRGVLFSPDSPTESELKSAEDFGKTIASRYNDKTPVIDNYDPLTPFMYSMQRIFVARPLSKIVYSKTFSADKNCNTCGICIKKCPTNNIAVGINGKLKWDSKCELCATCELKCPKDAIHSALDWKIFALFMMYNIRHSKNKRIPYVSVKHKKGKTIITENIK